MKLELVRKIFALGLFLVTTALIFSCEKKETAEGAAPGEIAKAYENLYRAVKSKDPEKIQAVMSKNSLGLAQMAAGQQKKPVEEVIKNGFTETTFSESLPKTRGEMVKGDYATVEVWNERRNDWEIIPFVKEDGVWKAAFGDMFSGSFQTPGKSQSIIEKENANAANPRTVPYAPNMNSSSNGVNPTINSNIKPIVPKPQQNTQQNK